MTDKQQPHPSSNRLGLTIALVVSLGVHGLLAWLATGTREKRERTQHVSVVTRPTSQLAERPRVAPVPQPVPDAQPRPASGAEPNGATAGQAHHPKGPLLDFPGMPGEATPLPTRLGTLPSKGTTTTPAREGTGANPNAVPGENVDLFDAHVISKTAHTYSTPTGVTEGANGPERGDLSEAQRAQSALDHMLTDQAEHNHVDKALKAPPELVALQVQTDRNFNPPPDSVAASRFKNGASEHEVGHLVALIDVSRSAGDSEPTIIVAQPSGDRLFDDAAMLAVKQALVSGPSTYAWSRWRFSAEVYRFSRKDMLLEPGFKPPGRRLPASSGAMSMTTSVRLLSFR